MGKFLENAFIYWPGHKIASNTQFCSMGRGVYTAIRSKITTVATPTIGFFTLNQKQTINNFFANKVYNAIAEDCGV
jgi:hypothetical protein